MSQVDDWSDGYASDYLRDLNTYGPASANVPRPSSVVSHQVQYQSPVAQTEAKTNDTPLYDNDGGFNPGPQRLVSAPARPFRGDATAAQRAARPKPASGYRAPAGGGWDVNSPDTNLRFPNEPGGRRYARSKTKASAKPVRKRTQKPAAPSGDDVTSTVVQAVRADGNTSFADWRQSLKNEGWTEEQAKAIVYDPSSGKFINTAKSPSSGGALTPDEQAMAERAASHRAEVPAAETPAESVASAAKNVTGQSAGRSDIDLSGLPRERSDMTPLPGDDWSPVDKAGAGINPFESDESLAAWKDLKLKSFPILPSEMAGGSPADAVTRFRQIAADPNSTVADVLSAENEAKKAAIDEGLTMDNIAAFEKEVALNLLFAGAGSAVNALRGVGGAARAASSTGNAWAAGSRAAAGDATAGAKAFEEALSRMNGGAVRGAPVEGAARRSFSSAGTAGSKTGGTAAGESAGARSFGFDLTPEQAARARTTHDAYVSGVAGRGAAAGAESAAGAGRAATGAESASARSFGFDVSPVEAAAARSSHDAYVQNMAELTSSLRRAGMPEAEIQSYIARSGLANNSEALQQAVLTIRKHGPSGLFERSADEAAAAGIYNPKYGKSPLETWQQERAATEAANAKFRDMFGFSDVDKLAEAGNVGRGAATAGGQAAGWTSDLVQQLRAAGIPEDQIAASIARINAGAAGREAAAAGAGRAGEAAAGSRSFRFDLSPEEAARARASHEAFVREAAAGRGSAGNGAAADGGVSELANAGNVGRETAAGAATGSVSEGVDLASQQLIQHIRSGTLDEMERTWIEALAAGAAKAPGTVNASTQAILNEARAAGILGREAAAGGQAAGREAAAAGGQAAGRGKVALTEQTAKQGLGDVRAAVKSSNIAYEDVMQSVADFAAGKSGNSLAIDIAQSYGQLYRSGFGNILSPRELAIAKAYEHATEGHMQGKFTDGMSQFVDGVLSGVPK